MPATSVKLDDGLKDRLKHIATTKRRSQHWLMKEAIAEYVEREEKREAFFADAHKAWENYQATGLHVTGEEVDTWLAELEAGNDVEPPKCHR